MQRKAIGVQTLLGSLAVQTWLLKVEVSLGVSGKQNKRMRDGECLMEAEYGYKEA